MYRCKYIITAQWKNGNDTFDIKQENFKTFMRDNNYDKENISKIVCSLTLDKNNVDKVIMNAKTASIFIYANKVHVEDDGATQTQDAAQQTAWSGEYSYFITDDINYNKEIDYANNPDKKDVYKSIFLGLYFKTANEENSATTNNVIVNTAIMNVVMDQLSAFPTTIQKFDYNEIVDQLTIPPQESLSKFIAFMNSYKVFYTTQYRFFIDCDCIYLLSSCGDSVAKKTEKYSSVYLTIQSLDKAEALVQGMEEDEANKRYSVDINVKDSNYSIDNTTCKYMNDISAIMDPSKGNSILNCEAMNNTINQINAQKEAINKKVDAILPILKQIPIGIRDIKVDCRARVTTLKEDMEKFKKLVDTLIEQIKKIPESAPDYTDENGASQTVKCFTMAGDKKQEYIKMVTDNMERANTTAEEFYKLNDVAASTGNTAIDASMATSMIPSSVNAVSAINVFDNKGLLNGFHSSLEAYKDSMMKKIMGPMAGCFGGGQMTYDATGEIVYEAKWLAEQTKNGAAAASGNAPAVEEPDITSTYEAMVPLQKEMASIVEGTQSDIDKFTNMKDVFKGIHEDLAATVKQVNTSSVDLGSTLSEFKPDWSGMAKGIQQNISGLLGNMKSAGGQIMNGGFKFGSLKDLQEDFSKVKDIAQLGKLGLSAFDLKLNLSTSGTGTAVLRLDNDNYNMLKNIKSSIENKANRLVVNKNDLDSEVFTPNKEYIIKNYDAHSDKDGTFILSRKVEFFVREDDKFTLNTMLEFDKVAEDSKSKKSKDAATTAETAAAEAERLQKAQKADRRAIILGARDIINDLKGGNFSIDSLQKVVATGADIQKSYADMNTVNGQLRINANKVANKEIGPNGVAYTDNDINYLISKGYTKADALDTLSKDPKYAKTTTTDTTKK